MIKEVFQAQNIKCGGCANTIREGLLQLDGVESVEVELDTGRVDVQGSDLSRERISAKLAELGYPEA